MKNMHPDHAVSSGGTASAPIALAANNTPLSPLRFLERSASVFPDRIAVVHGNRASVWSRPRTPASSIPR
ncbi:hypothetical protein [Rhodococcus sp. 27YEA15]|uniref:hypothetical protein n=1 Tax=Rhodococcus sp. 27YEA15 TaxID=3156259 RepID=UPI003C7E90E2